MAFEPTELYMSRTEKPIKGAIKFTDHYTKVSILKENEQLQPCPFRKSIQSKLKESTYL
jgi:hypothetical protein